MVNGKNKSRKTTEQEKATEQKTKLKHIFAIYKRDLKNILHNPVALLIILGLLILPSLYAWVNIVACWDPYGNTNGIKVAVVNLDQGVTLQGTDINAGDEIVKNLRENDAIGWQFVSKEDAEYGLTHDRYYAMLEIPEDFSLQLLNVLDKDYQKPQIIYRVNEKSNAIAPKITDTGAKTVTNEVTRSILDVVDKVVFSLSNGAGQEIENNETKIKKLRDVVLTVNANFAELEAELNKANEGLTTIEELLTSANDTLPLLEDGVSRLQDFSMQSSALLNEAQLLQRDGVDYVAGKFVQCQQLITETRDLLEETRTKLDDAEAFAQQIPPLVEKAERLQAKLEVLLHWLKQQDIPDPEYDKWLEQLQKAEQTSQKLIEILQGLEADPAQIQKTVLAVLDAVSDGMGKTEKALQMEEVILQDALEKAEIEEIRATLQEQLQKNREMQQELLQKQTEIRDKRETLAAMTPEEIAGQISAIEQDLQQMQELIRRAETLVQQAKDAGLDVDTVLQELEYLNSLMETGIQQVRSLLATADQAFMLSDEILDTAEQTLDEIEQIMQNVTDQYENRWSVMLETAFADLYGTLDDLDHALVKAEDAIPKVAALLELGNEAEGKSADLLAQLNDAVPAAKAELQRLSQVMAQFNDENLDKLIRFLENDADASAEFFSGPVELKTERLYHLDNYGSAMTPFYTVLAIWVGCLLLSAVLTTEALPVIAGRKNTMMEEYFGKLLTFLTLGFGQSLIVSLGDKFILGVTVTDLSIFLGFSLFTSFIFILIVYSLVSILGNVGKAICVILLVFQISGAGGTFPVEVMPKFYQVLQPYLPFTYAIGAMREAISGPVVENLFFDFWHLLLFGLLGLFLGITLKKPLRPLLEWFNAKFKESGLSE